MTNNHLQAERNRAASRSWRITAFACVLYAVVMMELIEAIRTRHAVRSYTGQPIEDNKIQDLNAVIERCNREGDLRMRLVTNEPEAFGNFLLHYGMFKNVRNYIAIICDDSAGWEEHCGYYGAQVLLRATQLVLDSCWVRLTFSKRKASTHAGVQGDEKLRFVITLGYGARPGHPHRSKTYAQVASVNGNSDPEAAPAWFRNGIEAVLLAPTSINQQKFTFRLESDGRTITANAGNGPCSVTDLGIAKLHFEIGAGKDADFVWA